MIKLPIPVINEIVDYQDKENDIIVFLKDIIDGSKYTINTAEYIKILNTHSNNYVGLSNVIEAFKHRDHNQHMIPYDAPYETKDLEKENKDKTYFKMYTVEVPESWNDNHNTAYFAKFDGKVAPDFMFEEADDFGNGNYWFTDVEIKEYDLDKFETKLVAIVAE